ncbi:MAG TPA: hypothetical protein VFS05_10350 [Gemmatimonadaceae bacterium]|nr:hypothetical protein [Gemmatimonadaceae bacterium]
MAPAGAPGVSSGTAREERGAGSGSGSAPPAAWDERPVALVGSGRRLRAVSRAATRRGVRAEMTVTEARARCAELELHDWDDVAIARALDAVTAALLAASPQVTPAAGMPGTWWVGATGFERAGGERAIIRSLLSIVRRWHPEARAAVADSCVAAYAATWGVEGRRAGGVVVPPGTDAAYLAPAPLALVPMDEEMRETLAALGMRTAGALAALEAGDVERRWGEAGLAAWRLARGEDRRRPVLARAESPRSVEVELASPAETAEPVLFFLGPCLERLARGLVADGRAAAAVAITLTLDGARSALPSGVHAHTVTREVRLPRPVARVGPLREHCRALLDTWSITAPIWGVGVAIPATAPLSGEQGDLLDTSWRDPQAADAAFARLRSELGAGVVVRAAERDAHRLDRAGVWVDALGDDALAAPLAPHRPDAATIVATPAFRLLDPPEAIEVEHADGAPCALWWRGRRLTIECAVGPERLSGEWWAEGYARDYWRCEGGEGDLLLFHDAGEDGWYVQGWYD